MTTSIDYKFKITKPINSIGFNKEYEYYDGDVVTKNGIVGVYSQGFNPSHIKSTRLEIVFNGVVHVRIICNSYSQKHLVTLANRFAEEVAKDNHD